MYDRYMALGLAKLNKPRRQNIYTNAALLAFVVLSTAYAATPAGAATLPCTLTDLLMPGVTIEVGGIVFSDFTVVYENGGVATDAITVSGNTGNGWAELSFVPTEGTFQVAGDFVDKTLEIAYLVSPTSVESLIHEVQIAVAGHGTGESGIRSEISMSDRSPFPVNFPLGVASAYIYPGYEAVLTSRHTLPVDVSRMLTAATFAVESYSTGSALLVSAEHRFVIAVPEPSASSLAIAAWASGILLVYYRSICGMIREFLNAG